MKQLLDLTYTDGIREAIHSFVSANEVDDIILSLVNDSIAEGFLKAKIQADRLTIVYSLSSYRAMKELSGRNVTLWQLDTLFTSLRKSVQYLEDSFVDLQYLVYDENFVFIDESVFELRLALLPVKESLEQERGLKDLAVSLIDNFSYALEEEQEFAQRARAAAISSCSGSEDISRIIAVLEQGAMKADAGMDTILGADAGRSQTTGDTKDFAVIGDNAAFDTETLPPVSPAQTGDAGTDEGSGPAPVRKTAYFYRKSTGEMINISQDVMVFGKMTSCCDYVVRGNPSISRIHAIIRYNSEDGCYYICDCNSTNHIYINGRMIPVDMAVRLDDKARVFLATEEFVYREQ
ncbi:MAG: FHA domain-containing protein [Lachnospiraceae bacterium]|nr:FHA domain-containing protein [Lachnospiraceae bacterium]